MLRLIGNGLLAFCLATGAWADLIADQDTLQFGSVLLGRVATRHVTVTNNGASAVEVTGEVFGDGFMTVEPISFLLQPGDSGVAVTVYFSTPEVGFYLGALLLFADDPTVPPLQLPLMAEGRSPWELPWIPLVLPDEGSYYQGLPITFLWERPTIPGHDNPLLLYTLWITPVGDSAWVSYDAGADTQYVLPDLEYAEGDSFLWRVTAVWDSGQVESLELRMFAMGTPPPVPHFSLITPANGDSLMASSYTFQWEELSQPLPRHFELIIDPTDNAYEPIVFTTDETHAFIDLRDIPHRMTCRWFVTAVLENSRVIHSDQVNTFMRLDPDSVTSSVAPRSADIPEAFGIESVAPNPFNPETRISITVPRAGHVRAEVLDILGRHVATLWDAPLSVGEHRLNWRPRGPAGIYFLQVRHAEGATDLRKLIFLK